MLLNKIGGFSDCMTCWHCNNQIELNYQTSDLLKFYHCSVCDKWYEMRKEKARVNGAVPIRFFELENRPPIQAAVKI